CTRCGAHSTVTTVTPVANCPRARRKSTEVSGAANMRFPEDNTGIGGALKALDARKKRAARKSRSCHADSRPPGVNAKADDPACLFLCCPYCLSSEAAVPWVVVSQPLFAVAVLWAVVSQPLSEVAVLWAVVSQPLSEVVVP